MDNLRDVNRSRKKEVLNNEKWGSSPKNLEKKNRVGSLLRPSFNLTPELQ
jgi:hypothetical protein